MVYHGRLLSAAILAGLAWCVPAVARAECPFLDSARITVIDAADGRPVVGARIEGPGIALETDRSGVAAVCLPGRGLANVTVARGGFETATATMASGRYSHGSLVVVRLVARTLTSIGGTSTTASRVPLNTQPGSYSVIGRAQIDDQAQPQLARLFDETPGVLSNHTASSNPASPGAQTSPNLRGALDYEKTTLIDGHPVATGRFGDYVTSFLSPYVLQDVEIAKGPGAFAPLVVNGIGGSINFRTRDPAARPTTSLDVGFDGFGGSLVHALGSSTIGKLGFVVDAVTYGTPGAFKALPATVALPAGTQIAGVGTIGSTTSATPPAGTPPGAFPAANAQNNPANAYVRLVACCQAVDSSFLGRSEVLKARWRFSEATTLTAAYVGNQSAFGLDGAQLQTLNATFVPSGTPVALNPTTHLPSNVAELENEPLFEAELRTALRNDTVIARWYTVSLNRFTGNSTATPAQPFTGVVALTGNAPLTGGGTTPSFTGQPQTITIPDVYSRTVEEDRVRGGSFAWIHPAGVNEYELAVDRIVSLTNAYSVGASGGNAVFSASVPAGSAQTITSFLARGTVRPNDTDALTLAAYATTYRNHVSTGPVGNGFAFADATHSELDPAARLHASPARQRRRAPLLDGGRGHAAGIQRAQRREPDAGRGVPPRRDVDHRDAQRGHAAAGDVVRLRRRRRRPHFARFGRDVRRVPHQRARSARDDRDAGRDVHAARRDGGDPRVRERRGECRKLALLRLRRLASQRPAHRVRLRRARRAHARVCVRRVAVAVRHRGRARSARTSRSFPA